MLVKAVRESKFPVILEKHYVVYGMTIRKNDIWYFICNEHYTYYPNWVPCTAFEVVCDRLSRYWKYPSYQDKDYHLVIAFPEWTDDPFDYYDNLVEGDDKEIEIFEKYKKIMDLEFFHPQITAIAEIGDAEWLICRLCIDAWSSLNNRDALVVCPKCNTVMNNPRYLDNKAEVACINL